MNYLDYSSNVHVKNFFNLAFENGIFPIINRPTRVTKTSETVIDHILTNTILNSDVESGIIKCDISDHFAIFSTFKCTLEKHDSKQFITKRDINENSIEYFKSLWVLLIGIY